jgi:hypothetical protein
LSIAQYHHPDKQALDTIIPSDSTHHNEDIAPAFVEVLSSHMKDENKKDKIFLLYPTAI